MSTEGRWFERTLLAKLLHERHHDQDCERTADAILDRGFHLRESVEPERSVDDPEARRRDRQVKSSITFWPPR